MALTTKPAIRKNVYKEEAIKSVQVDNMTKLTVNISKRLRSEFKIAAIKNNANMTDLITEWIKLYIQK